MKTGRLSGRFHQWHNALRERRAFGFDERFVTGEAASAEISNSGRCSGSKYRWQIDVPKASANGHSCGLGTHELKIESGAAD